MDVNSKSALQQSGMILYIISMGLKFKTHGNQIYKESFCEFRHPRASMIFWGGYYKMKRSRI